MEEFFKDSMESLALFSLTVSKKMNEYSLDRRAIVQDAHSPEERMAAAILCLFVGVRYSMEYGHMHACMEFWPDLALEYKQTWQQPWNTIFFIHHAI